MAQVMTTGFLNKLDKLYKEIETLFDREGLVIDDQQGQFIFPTYNTNGGLDEQLLFVIKFKSKEKP